MINKLSKIKELEKMYQCMKNETQSIVLEHLKNLNTAVIQLLI